MKKIFFFCEMIFAALIEAISAIYLTDRVLDYTLFGEQDPVFQYELMSGILMMGFWFWIINLMNRQFDRAAGYAGKTRPIGRWVRSVLMIVAILTLAEALIVIVEYQADTGKNSDMILTEEIVSFAAAALAIYLYVRNYHKTKEVGLRIHDLMNQNVLHKDRRYTLVVDKTWPVKNGITTVGGIIHGEIRTGDEIYAIFQDTVEGKTYRVHELKEEDKKVRKAKNIYVTVTLSGVTDVEKIPIFTVMSDIHPYFSTPSSEVNNTENPYLSGLLQEYTRLHNDDQYSGLLYYCICHAKYLIAGVGNGSKGVSGDIVDVPRNNTDVGFSAVMQTGRKEQIFPVFTDWEALRRWKDIVNAEKSITLVMDFPQIASVLGNGFDGMVIDPFGPRPFELSNEMVKDITSSTGYRNDFILHKKEGEN